MEQGMSNSLAGAWRVTNILSYFLYLTVQSGNPFYWGAPEMRGF